MIPRPYLEEYYQKIKAIIPIYADKIYNKVNNIETVYAYETSEHLRTVPSVEYKSISSGTSWGGEWQNIWLKCKYTVPEELCGQEIYIYPDVEAVEVLCFVNGKPCGMINSRPTDVLGGMHDAMRLCEDAKVGAEYEIAFECYAGHTIPSSAPYYPYVANAKPRFQHTFRGIRVMTLDRDMREFVFDLSAVYQMAIELKNCDRLKAKAGNALENCYNYLIFDPANCSDDEIKDSVIKTDEILKAALCGCNDVGYHGKVALIGHSHLDTAWNWPYSETIRKCARTYSEALELMDEYPCYNFIQSSALHTSWMEEYYPNIFDKMKMRIKDGRYEPNGGVWVEFDANIPCGEALIRNMMYGQRYTLKKFGYMSDTLWLPDCFGFSPALPQLMLGCGIHNFATVKLSWNDCNTFPYQTFRWDGFDGSEVLAHFFAIGTTPDVAGVSKHIDAVKDKTNVDTALMAYGFGDGGGGPSRGMLESMKRVQNIRGLAKVYPTTVSSFMDEIREHYDELPKYSGELYLELHRGTYTSIHDNKRNNRIAESELHDFEFVNVWSGKPKNTKTEEYYKILLLNQFHDILPGSSIKCVNDTANIEMRGLIEKLECEINDYVGEKSESSRNITLLNTAPFPYSKDDIILLPSHNVKTAGALSQEYIDIAGREMTAVGNINIPALSSVCLEYKNGDECQSVFGFDGNTLITPLYSVNFDENGYISSLKTNSGRELCAENGMPLGTFMLGEDIPMQHENWDIEYLQSRKMKPVTKLLSREVVSDGALRFALRSKYALGNNSTVTTDVIFYSSSERIDYHTVVDWHEKRKLLKVKFDLNIKSNTMKNETQFGYIERPMTRNNLLEAAKYEVCNHRYTDISETRFGISLLNDCKYGISGCGNTLALTLLKGGLRPDERGDEGVHEMRYALLPHKGGFSADNTVKQAYLFNSYPKVFNKTLADLTACEISESNIICDTLKYAEDVQKAVVLRLYECEGSHTDCKIKISDKCGSIYITDMLENIKDELHVSDGCVNLSFKPFEVKTLLIKDYSMLMK